MRAWEYQDVVNQRLSVKRHYEKTEKTTRKVMSNDVIFL